jgi:hypothetical protein
MDSYRQLCAGKVHTRAADRIVWSVASGPHPDESFLLMIYASSSQRAQSVEVIAMPVVKFPGQPKRPPFAVAAFDPKRERMLLRAERVVELLGSRAIRDGWSFDKNRAARFLHCLRTFDRNDANSPEVAEIVRWALDHEQSLQWIFTGNIDEMICTLAYHSPGKRQTRVLEGV